MLISKFPFVACLKTVVAEEESLFGTNRLDKALQKNLWSLKERKKIAKNSSDDVVAPTTFDDESGKQQFFSESDKT